MVLVVVMVKKIVEEFAFFMSEQNILESKSKVDMHLMEEVKPKTEGFDILSW